MTDDLGYPATIEMPDGSLMGAYYKNENGTARIKLATYAEAYISDNPNFHNTFEGLEENTANYPKIWRLSGSAQTVGITSTTKHSGENALFLNDTSAAAAPSATRTLYSFEQSDGVVSFWMYPASLPNGFEFGLMNGDNAQTAWKIFWFRITPEGSLEYMKYMPGNPVWSPLSTNVIELGKWTKITLRFTDQNTPAEILMNGVSVGTAAPFAAGGDISYLGFYTASPEGVGDVVYLDDIYTQQHADVQPAATVNEEEGIYINDNPIITPLSTNLGSIRSLYAFSESATKNGGEIRYQLSNNGGATWHWWNGAVWALAAEGYAEANTAVVVNQRIRNFPVGAGAVVFKAYLHSDGTNDVRLDAVTIRYLNQAARQLYPVSD